MASLLAFDEETRVVLFSDSELAYNLLDKELSIKITLVNSNGDEVVFK